MRRFTLNRQPVCIDSAPSLPLLHALRHQCGDSSVRFGCGTGDCGACTVSIDGRAETACTVAVEAIEGREVGTAAGLPEDPVGRIVLQAFTEEQAAQCGYCIAGIMVRATALLSREPDAMDSRVREVLSRNLCRCGSHSRILRAVTKARSALQAGA